MKKNMGTIDRVFRALVAVAIIVLYLANIISGIVAIILLAIAAIFILTSFMSFCPLYYPFKISTKRAEQK